MKKTNYLAILFLIIGIAATSCKKDNNTIKEYGTSVNATEKLLTLPIYDPVSYVNNGGRNRGYEFKSSKNGRITEIGARTSTGIYTVTLWDSSAQTILKSVNVSSSDANSFSYSDVDDINIQANKVYVITVNNATVGSGITTSAVFYGITTGANYLPQTVGDITYLASVEKSTLNPSSLFPYTFSPEHDIVMGMPTFKFEPKL
ncbi:MAG TPA: DUF4082 domain-containing protein [Chitinophagales bacterium]|nr:DUF4082 domain-containing protein [Chitinophagales bacterium]